MTENTDYNVLQFDRWDGGKAFVEINEAFDIQKIRLGFREYDKTQAAGSRIRQSIDFYLSPHDALKMAEYILSGVVKSRRVKWANDPNRNDNAEFYATAPGGSSSGGKTIYRIVKIQPGRKGYRICAYTADGRRDERGLIQPVKGAKFSYVMIPVDGIELGIFARMLTIAVNSYYQIKTDDWKEKKEQQKLIQSHQLNQQ